MRAVIFDYDGVILDSETVVARMWIELLALRGVALGLPDLAPFFGTTHGENQREWEQQLENWLGSGIAAAAVVAAGDERSRQLRARIPVMPGVHRLLQFARKAGWPVGIATGQRRPLVDAELRGLGLGEAFDVIVTGADVRHGKPAPDLFLECAARLGVPAPECVAIEDSVPGCYAALAAGTCVVLCPCELTAGLEFPAVPIRVASLAELDLAVLSGEHLPTQE